VSRGVGSRNGPTEPLERGPLAQGLQASVSLGIYRFGGRVVQDCQRSVFVKARDERFGVRRNRRDVDVTSTTSPEDLGKVADLARKIRRGIDSCIPAASGEGTEVAVAVAQAMLRVGEQPWVGRAPVEQRHVAPVRQQCRNDVPPDELSPPDYKDLHGRILRAA
jgi:hypothetical protein